MKTEHIMAQELARILINSPRSIIDKPFPKELELRLYKKVLERLKIIQ